MRRRLYTLALTLSVLVLTALPALATEGGDIPAVQTEQPEINGILFALIVGSIVGLIMFLDAYRGDPGHREHHADEAGH